MTSFSKLEQETLDVDWFATDKSGMVAHFASAGRPLPTCIENSKTAVLKLAKFFRGLQEKSDVKVHEAVWKFVDVHPAQRPQYLADFLSMARKGLFSYDSPLEFKDGPKPYFCVCIPVTPLKIDQLPSEIRAMLGKFKILSKDILLENLICDADFCIQEAEGTISRTEHG